MIPEKLLEVFKYEGVVAIATQGEEGPHLVNTWNSYVQVTGDRGLVIPAGYMKTTEANIAKDNKVLITLASREVEGNHGPGIGFLIKGTAAFQTSGSNFEDVKQRFPWARAALVVTITSATQTL